MFWRESILGQPSRLLGSIASSQPPAVAGSSQDSAFRLTPKPFVHGALLQRPTVSPLHQPPIGALIRQHALGGAPSNRDADSDSDGEYSPLSDNSSYKNDNLPTIDPKNLRRRHKTVNYSEGIIHVIIKIMKFTPECFHKSDLKYLKMT